MRSAMVGGRVALSSGMFFDLQFTRFDLTVASLKQMFCVK